MHLPWWKASLEKVGTWNTAHILSQSLLGLSDLTGNVSDCWIFYCCITTKDIEQTGKIFSFSPLWWPQDQSMSGVKQCSCKVQFSFAFQQQKHLWLPTASAFQFGRITVACSCKGQTLGPECPLKVISFGFEWRLNYISLPCRKKESRLKKKENCLKCTMSFLGTDGIEFRGSWIPA